MRALTCLMRSGQKIWLQVAIAPDTVGCDGLRTVRVLTRPSHIC